MTQINIQHLSFAFGSHWALKNITFQVQKGEFLFVTGPSGAGKTTLLRILHGALPVQRGEAQVVGFDLKKLNSRSIPRLRSQVSVVFQDFKVLEDRTVFENVALPLEIRALAKPQINRRVRAVLRGLNLANKENLHCRVLSGGEQQRVAIARAVVVSPKILLADEPTGNLDDELANRLLEVFKQFNLHGTTILLATHNQKILETRPESRILFLRDGSLH